MRLYLFSAVVSLVAHASRVAAAQIPHLTSFSSLEDVAASYVVVLRGGLQGEIVRSHLEWVERIHLEKSYWKAKLRKQSRFQDADHDIKRVKHTYNIGGGLVGYSGYFDESLIKRIDQCTEVRSNSLVRRRS